MNEETNEEETDEFGRIVDEFMADMRSDQRPSIEAYVSRYPGLGDKLREILTLVLRIEGHSTHDTDRNTPQKAAETRWLLEEATVQPDYPNATDRQSVSSEVKAKPTQYRRMGKFEALEQIGQGGFGQVWKARDTQLGRLVAIKLLRAQLLDDQPTRERFLREARAAGQLRHPNIVPVYEVAELEGTPAIISSLVSGVTLKELLQQRKLDFRESATLMVEISSAIEYAHSMNLIHRDIKPANIMVEHETSPGRGKRPMVLDFGLALRDEIEATMTVEGQVLGTPAYMSPEQARGQGHHVDRRSDVYSLGTVLYEMLCGQPPFVGSKVAILHQVLHDEPRALHLLCPEVPKDLETICQKAMAKAPAQRYATADEYAKDLSRWLQDEPIEARPPTFLEQTRRWFKRYPALAGSVLAIMAMLMIFSSVAVVYAFRFQRLAFQANQERQLADRARVQEAQALTASRLALQQMYTSFGTQSERNGQPAQGAPWFVKAIEQASAVHHSQSQWETASVGWQALASGPPAERADQANAHGDWPLWLQLQNCSLSSATPVLAWHYQSSTAVLSKEPKQLNWSPDGQWLAIESTDGIESIWALTEDKHWNFTFVDQEIQLQPLPEAYQPTDKLSSACWTIDGQHLLACQAGHRVLKVAMGSGHAVASCELSEPIVGLELSGDGMTLVAIAESRLLLLRASDLSLIGQIESVSPVQLSVSFDAQQIAIYGRDNTVRVFRADPTTGRYRQAGNHAAGPKVTGLANGIQFREAGDLLWLGPDSSLSTLKPNDNDQPSLTRAGEIQAIRFSPSGRLGLASRVFEGRILETQTSNWIGTTIHHRNHLLDASFSHDEALVAIAAGDRTVGIYYTASGLPAMPLIQHQGDLRRVSFSPDSRYVATGQLDGLVRVWKLPAPYQTIDTGSLDQYLEVSHDGKRAIAGPWQGFRWVKSVQPVDLKTGQPVGQRYSHSSFIDGAFFSPLDSEKLVLLLTHDRGPPTTQDPRVEFENQTGSLVFWNSTTGETSQPIVSDSEFIGGAWSPDASKVAAINYRGEILVVDATSQQVVTRLDHGDSYSPYFLTRKRIAFSPDGKTLIAWTRLRTSFWDTRTWELITDYRIGLPGAQHFTHDVVSSHDSRYQAICNSFKHVAIVDVQEKRLIGKLPHPDWVFSAHFSPDDKQLATTCRDGEVRIWDWRSGQQINKPLLHEDEAWSVDYSDDGRWIVTGARDSCIRFWDAQSGQPISPAIRMPFWVYEVKTVASQNCVVASGNAAGVSVFDLNVTLPPSPALSKRTFDELVQYSELMSSQRMVDDNVTNLTTESWVQVWNQVQKTGLLARYAPLDTASRQANLLTRITRSFQAAYSRGDWKACRQGLEQMIELRPSYWRAYFELNVLLAYENDRQALRELQGRIVTLFGNSQDNASQTEQVSKSLLVDEELSEHWPLGIKLAEVATSNLQGGPYDGWFMLNLGLARLRQKRWPEAEEIFDQLSGNLRDHAAAQVLACSARAKRELGKLAEATASIDQARQILKAAPDPKSGSLYQADWSDWLRAMLAVREYETTQPAP